MIFKLGLNIKELNDIGFSASVQHILYLSNPCKLHVKVTLNKYSAMRQVAISHHTALHCPSQPNWRNKICIIDAGVYYEILQHNIVYFAIISWQSIKIRSSSVIFTFCIFHTEQKIHNFSYFFNVILSLLVFVSEFVSDN